MGICTCTSEEVSRGFISPSRAGILEGRQLGVDKGRELGHELGYYAGTLSPRSHNLVDLPSMFPKVAVYQRCVLIWNICRHMGLSKRPRQVRFEVLADRTIKACVDRTIKACVGSHHQTCVGLRRIAPSKHALDCSAHISALSLCTPSTALLLCLCLFARTILVIQGSCQLHPRRMRTVHAACQVENSR